MSEPKSLSPLPRLNLWKVTVCRECGESFEQLHTGKRRICKECHLVSQKGGKR